MSMTEQNVRVGIVKRAVLNGEAILQHMREGWELGLNNGLNPRTWLQKDGLCKGGETKNVSMNVVSSLRNKKKIAVEPRREKDPYWLTRYKLNG
jgi:hypothetical protein